LFFITTLLRGSGLPLVGEAGAIMAEGKSDCLPEDLCDLPTEGVLCGFF